MRPEGLTCVPLTIEKELGGTMACFKVGGLGDDRGRQGNAGKKIANSRFPR